MPKASSESLRLDYATRIACMAGVADVRIREAFAAVPREDFLPLAPWTIISAGIATRTDDLADLYDNVLVAIDRARGINNGEPALHAAWLDAVRPRPGDAVIHVGAGTGYYTAMLMLLVEPGGRVDAYEYEADLATAATRNLKSYPDVTVHADSAFGAVLPEADVIYVNAGVAAPDPEWLRALKPGGRLVFPWQPQEGWGTAMLVSRMGRGYRALRLMNVAFIACRGETARKGGGGGPSEADIAATRSLWLTAERSPDRTATAVYDDLWFSSGSLDEG